MSMLVDSFMIFIVRHYHSHHLQSRMEAPGGPAMLKSIRYMLLVALCLVATACDLSSKSGTSVDPTPTPSPTPGPNGCTDPQPSTYSGYSGGLNDITML